MNSVLRIAIVCIAGLLWLALWGRSGGIRRVDRKEGALPRKRVHVLPRSTGTTPRR
jgi:hypothetical protein